MTLEEIVALHTQMLLSIESNLEKAAADIAVLGQRQAQLEENQARIVENQALFLQNQALTAESIRLLASSVAELTRTVDQYIRFRGDGQARN